MPSTEGVELAVYDYGGHGPTLLVAHATGFHGRAYDPMLDHLPGFRRISIDLRGHGRATAPDDIDYRWEGCADDLLAVVDALDLAAAGPLYGFGHSMGGAALLMTAPRRPGLLAGLVCYEPVIYPSELTAADFGLDAWVERTRHRRSRFDSFAAARANFASKRPCKVFHPAALDAYVDHGFRATPGGGVEIRCRPETEARLYAMGPRHSCRDTLHEVDCPVVLLRGAILDPAGPAHWIRTILDELRDAEFREVQGLSHLGPMEYPKQVAQLTEAALRKLSQS